LYNEAEMEEIDILVKEKDLSKVRDIINSRKECKDTGRIIDLTHPLLVEVKLEDEKLLLDFQIKGIGFIGVLVLKEDILINRTHRKNNLPVLTDHYDFLALFTHSFLFHGDFRKYKKELSEKAHFKKNQEVLKQFYGEELGSKFINFCKEKKFDEILKFRNYYRFRYLLRRLTKVADVLISILYQNLTKSKRPY